MSTNKQELRSKARSASAGEWIKESGDGWDAICSSDDQANCSFVIAHFEGPDSTANREFVQAASPDVVLALLDELEAAEKRIAELEALDKPRFVQCWSCKHDIEVLAIADCDGYCPRCAAPIDLDDETYSGITVKGE